MKHLAPALFLLFFVACSDESSPDPFALEITVKDALDRSLPGVQVRCLPLLGGFAAAEFRTVKARPSCTIPYDVAETAVVKLVVYDLEGTSVKTLVDAIQTAGPYTASWDGFDELDMLRASGMYEFVFTAHEMATADLLYRDSVFAYLWYPNVIGTTDELGRVQTTARSWFPTLYALPPATATNSLGDSIGVLELQDSIQVLLSHSSLGAAGFTVPIKDGPNRIEWNWSAATRKTKPSFPPGESVFELRRQALAWRLHPVYPNPFN